MRSTGSPSTASPDVQRRRRRRRWANWPEDLLLPALLAAVQALAITPILHLFLGPQFGLTAGREVPWPGFLAMVGLVAFALCRFANRLSDDPRVLQATIVVGWLVTTLVWLGLEPQYGVRGLIAEPGSLVTTRGWLIAPMLLSLGVWAQGVRYGTNDFLLSAEEVRGTTQRSWMVLIGSLIVATLLNNQAGDAALGAAILVIPLAMLVSIALVAAAEVHTSRQQIRQTGGRPPTWARWSRLVSGVGVGFAAVAVLVLVLLTPGALAAMIGAIVFVLQAFGQLLLWVMYGVVYVLYYVVVAATELLRMLFGVDTGPMEMPSMPNPPQQLEFAEQEEGEPSPYATLVRWGLLGIVVAIVLLVVLRIVRGRRADEGSALGDEERSSVFSADLAKAQLRDLLRRRRRDARIGMLDLDAVPASVRETWRYLQILAVRQGVARRDAETPRDFSARLRAVWPGTAAALNDLARRYERSRYGEIDVERDRTAAVEAWTAIYRNRRDALGDPDER